MYQCMFIYKYLFLNQLNSLTPFHWLPLDLSQAKCYAYIVMLLVFSLVLIGLIKYLYNFLDILRYRPNEDRQTEDLFKLASCGL